MRSSACARGLSWPAAWRSLPSKCEGFRYFSLRLRSLASSGMTRHPHRRTIAGAPRLIRRASLIAVAAMAVAAAPSSAATGAQLDGDTLRIFGDNGEQTLAIVNQPTTFALDIGNNGTADFPFERSN